MVCYQCEIDRLRESTLDWAARCGETQAQLEKVTDEMFAFRERNKAQHVEIKRLTDYSFGQDKELNRLGSELARAQEESAKLFGWYNDAEQGMARRNARIAELNAIIEASWAKAFEDDKEITRLKLALSEAHKKYNDSLIHATNAEQYLSGEIAKAHIKGMEESARIVRQRAVHTRGERELLEEVSAALRNRIKELP